MPGNPSLTAFAALSPPWSLTQLDTNFTNVATLLKSANNYSNYLLDGGAANAYTVSFGAGITVALTAGLMVQFKAANANTAAATLNVNGLGAKSIVQQDGSALVAGDIPAGGVLTVIYDGTNFILDSINVANFARKSAGSWTPTDASGAGLTLTTAGCVYIRNGDLVWATFDITYPVTASGLDALIGGLPSTSANTGSNTMPVVISFDNSGVVAKSRIISNSATFQFVTTAGLAVTNTQLSTKVVRGAAIYKGT